MTKEQAREIMKRNNRKHTITDSGVHFESFGEQDAKELQEAIDFFIELLNKTRINETTRSSVQL